jgi:hypothetical protein
MTFPFIENSISVLYFISLPCIPESDQDQPPTGFKIKEAQDAHPYIISTPPSQVLPPPNSKFNNKKETPFNSHPFTPPQISSSALSSPVHTPLALSSSSPSPPSAKSAHSPAYASPHAPQHQIPAHSQARNRESPPNSQKYPQCNSSA